MADCPKRAEGARGAFGRAGKGQDRRIPANEVGGQQGKGKGDRAHAAWAEEEGPHDSAAADTISPNGDAPSSET